MWEWSNHHAMEDLGESQPSSICFITHQHKCCLSRTIGAGSTKQARITPTPWKKHV